MTATAIQADYFLSDYASGVTEKRKLLTEVSANKQLVRVLPNNLRNAEIHAQLMYYRNGSIEHLDLELEFPQNHLPVWIKDILARANKLLNLPVGWDSYSATPICVNSVQTAMELVAHLANTDIPRPTLVPLADGGVQIEWHVGGKELAIAIAPRGPIEIISDDGDFELADSNSVDRLQKLTKELRD